MARSRSRGFSKTKLAIALAVLVTSSFAVYLLYPETNRLVYDWRLKLHILDARVNAPTGENFTPPADIGVQGGIWVYHSLDPYGPQGYAPLSTRDSTGTIYIQSRVSRVYLIGEFFAIWGQTFNRTCVGYGRGTYCGGASNPSNPPPWMSDGTSERCLDPTLILSNGKDWLIVVGSSLGTAYCS